MKSKINNFDLVTEFIKDKFYDENTFYFLQIIQRKKDNPDQYKSCRAVKSYYIHSIENLEYRSEEIVELCNKYNARAYINLNPRSFKAVAFAMLKNVANAIYNQEYKSVVKLYDSCCGQTCSSQKKLWLIDIDEPCEYSIDSIGDYVNSQMPINSEQKIKLIVPTLHGKHIFTTPFDRSKFNIEFPNIDLHKDNPTLLYCNLKCLSNETNQIKES